MAVAPPRRARPRHRAGRTPRDRRRVARLRRRARRRRPRAGLLLHSGARVGAGRRGDPRRRARGAPPRPPRRRRRRLVRARGGGLRRGDVRRRHDVPGPAALVPVLGAGALVAAGTSAVPSAPTRFFAREPVQYLGRRSYAWYVWHWPVLVFAGAAWGPPSPLEGVAVAAASLLPALVTYRWIEEPLRRSRVHARMPRATLAAAPAGASLAVDPGARASPPRCRRRRRSPRTPRTAPRGWSGRAAIQARPVRCARRRATPTRTARAPTTTAAWCPRSRPARPACVYGDRGAPTTVVLFGDSHAMQYFPALQRIARPPPLAPRRADEGRLPAGGGDASTAPSSAARTPSATPGASTR